MDARANLCAVTTDPFRLIFRLPVIAESLPRWECRGWIVALVLKVKLSRRGITGSGTVEDFAGACALLSRRERKPYTDLSSRSCSS